VQARHWFALALFLFALDAALVAALLSQGGPDRVAAVPSMIRVPDDDELPLWDRPYFEEFGLVTRGEWVRASERLANDFRSGRATIDEAFVFALGALQGLDWNSARADSTGTVTSYSLRTIGGEDVGWASLRSASRWRPADLLLAVSCSSPAPGPTSAPVHTTEIRVHVTPEYPVFVEELERSGAMFNVWGEIASVRCEQSIDISDPEVAALRLGDELCIGGGFTWDGSGGLSGRRKFARVVARDPRGPQFESVEVDCATPNPGFVADDGRFRIQQLLDRR
jgi:hypothetical protein